MNNFASRLPADLGDISNIFNSWIGVDRLFESLIADKALAAPTYPPYDLIKRGDDKYSIVLAVAGFQLEEIDIVLDKGKLLVSSKKNEESGDDGTIYIKKGIAKRHFNLAFTLSEHVVVDEAVLKDGLLTINFSVIFPEELQPKKIIIAREPAQVPALDATVQVD